MDQLDQAQALEERERDAALARFRRRLLRQAQDEAKAPPRNGCCVDCGGAIEPERRRTLPNAVRCAACARAWAE